MKNSKLQIFTGGGYSAPSASRLDISAEKGFAFSITDPEHKWGDKDNDEFGDE